MNARLWSVVPAAMLVACLGATATPAPVAAQWRLADVPVFEIGRDDGEWLHRVEDATFAQDGSLLVADNSDRRVLRISEAGEVVESRGKKGNGPGEFSWIERVFALGDTVLAVDPFLARVTTWVGNADPEVVALPKPGGVGTGLEGVVSAKTWLLSTWGNAGADDSATGFLEQWEEFMLFDADTREVTKVDRRLVSYDYNVVQSIGHTVYSLDFMGEAHVSATRDHWLVVPMDEPVLVRGSLTGQAASPVPLPLRLEPYPRRLLRQQREEWLSRASGSSAARVRLVFDNLPGEMPELAPPVRRLVHVGADLWLQKFGNGIEDETSEWMVVDPASGAVRATASIDAEVELLGGNDRLAVVVVRTELDEEVVQVRRILR